jgi:hypothetical protein
MPVRIYECVRLGDGRMNCVLVKLGKTSKGITANIITSCFYPGFINLASTKVEYYE